MKEEPSGGGFDTGCLWVPSEDTNQIGYRVLKGSHQGHKLKDLLELSKDVLEPIMKEKSSVLGFI